MKFRRLLQTGIFLTTLATTLVNGAEPPRAARSVHLGFPAPDAILFYHEMVIEATTGGSYFMACGWDTGYFGLQELADHRQVILFSVWDPTRGDDPKAVPEPERVEVLFQAPDVRVRRFGGEGTGGQCLGDFAWRMGDTNRFVVEAAVENGKTSYSGHVWQAAERRWKKLVTFRTRTGGRELRGLYSFVEDFRRDTRSVQDVRRARFGNGWVRTTGGQWTALGTARFTASGAEWESKENIDAGQEHGWFYLATGGATRMSMPLDGTISKPEGEKISPPTLLPKPR